MVNFISSYGNWFVVLLSCVVESILSLFVCMYALVANEDEELYAVQETSVADDVHREMTERLYGQQQISFTVRIVTSLHASSGAECNIEKCWKCS